MPPCGWVRGGDGCGVDGGAAPGLGSQASRPALVTSSPGVLSGRPWSSLGSPGFPAVACPAYGF